MLYLSTILLKHLNPIRLENLADVLLNLEQKPLTTPECINNENLKPVSLANVEEIELKGGGI